MKEKFYLKQGYWIDFSEQNSQLQGIKYKHIFCGSHNVDGAWCPNCNKPLLRLITFDTKDRRLKLGGFNVSTFPLFYCWTCQILEDSLIYRVKENAIEIIKYKKGDSYNDHPYDNYPLYFPERTAILTAMTAKEEALIHSMYSNGYMDEEQEALMDDFPKVFGYVHQIGGEMILLDPDDQLSCPVCKEMMPLFAIIGDENSSQKGFVSEDIQMVYSICENCKIVGVKHTCT